MRPADSSLSVSLLSIKRLGEPIKSGKKKQLRLPPPSETQPDPDEVVQAGKNPVQTDKSPAALFSRFACLFILREDIGGRIRSVRIGLGMPISFQSEPG